MIEKYLYREVSPKRKHVEKRMMESVIEPNTDKKE
jgi:hypothetical protein